jgi:hypothetical protein
MKIHERIEEVPGTPEFPRWVTFPRYERLGFFELERVIQNRNAEPLTFLPFFSYNPFVR